ncbi:hypothetical protein GCM10009678_93510 [Actinomadura kijaniata]
MWSLQQASGIGADGELAVLADGETVCASTLIVLGAFEALTDTLGTYHGHDPRKAVAAVRRRMVAVMDRQQRWREQMQHDLRLLGG